MRYADEHGSVQRRVTRNLLRIRLGERFCRSATSTLLSTTLLRVVAQANHRVDPFADVALAARVNLDLPAIYGEVVLSQTLRELYLPRAN